MKFVWDCNKAAGNILKHGIGFEEASAVFLDGLSATGADPDHSFGEERWVTFGISSWGNFLVVAHTDQVDTLSAPARAQSAKGCSMKKPKSEASDSLRPEYQSSDFPCGLVRGKFVTRTQASSNIAILEPELAFAFPNSAAVNDALRAILKVAKNVAAQS